MKKLFIIVMLAGALAGCQTTQQKTVPVVSFQHIEIPSQLLDCKSKVITIPDPKTLTNKQVSKFILKLKELLEECQNDSASIERLITEYNAEVDKINERLLNNAKNK